MGEGLALVVKSVTVLLGFALIIMGATEMGVAIMDGSGAFLVGLPVFLLGVAIAAVPILMGFRDMIEAAREEGRLPPKESKARGGDR